MPIPARQFDQAAKLLGPARRVLLTTHIRPDGDAIGCVVAMRQILRASGKDVLAVLLDPVPQHYELLSQPEPLLVWSRQVGPRDLGQLDAIVVLDTCSYSQLEPIADLLRSTSATKIVVDHHLTRDDLADCYLIDPQAAAASVLVWQWARQAGWPIDPVAARALFVGISTDTGWFRFANTDAVLLRVAAGLVEAGVRPDQLYRRLYLNEPERRLRLLGHMLQSLELYHDGQIAVVCITAQTLQRCQAQPGDTEDLINEPQRIGSVLLTALLLEEPDGRVRLSLRSRCDVDVAAIASRFGGGGHALAAGARAHMGLDDFKRQVVAALQDALDARADE